MSANKEQPTGQVIAFTPRKPRRYSADPEWDALLHEIEAGCRHQWSAQTAEVIEFPRRST